MDRRSHWVPNFLGVWSLYAVVVFCVMLTEKSDLPVLFGRYSPLVVASLAALLIGSIGAFSIRHLLLTNPLFLDAIDERLVSLRSRSWFQPTAVIICGCLLAGIWLFFLGDHLPTYGFLRSFLCLSVILGGLALIFGGTEMHNAVNWRIVFIVCLVALLLIALITVKQRPALLKLDEAFFAAKIQTVLNTNGASTQPLIYRFDAQNDFEGGLWTRLALPYFQVAGLSLATARLFFLTFGFVSIPFLFLSLKRWYGPITAWMGIVLASYAVASHNYVRPDVVSALFLSATFFFYSLSEKHNGYHLLTGLSVAMCIDSSPITYVFGVGFTLFYIVKYACNLREQRQWVWKPFWLLVAGEMLVVIYFLFTRSRLASLPGGATTVELATQYISSIGVHITSGSFLNIANQVFTSFFTSQPILSTLATIGILVSLRERKSSDMLLVTLFATWMVIIVFTYIYFPAYNINYAMPLVVALAARGVAFGLGLAIRVGSSDNLPYIRTIGVLIGLWLLIASIADIRSALSPSNSLLDVVNTGVEIGKLLPKDAVVVAAEPFYFGLIDHQNFVAGLSDQILIGSMNYTDEQVWKIIKPDAIVHSQSRPTEPTLGPELLDYMKLHNFGLVSCWRTLSYGRIDLWVRDSLSAVKSDTVCPFISN